MGFTKPTTRDRKNPHPWLRVRVLTGTGAGCPEKPQGSPLQSLVSWALGMFLNVLFSLYYQFFTTRLSTNTATINSPIATTITPYPTPTRAWDTSVFQAPGTTTIRVVHGSHSWAIFGLFSNSFLGSTLHCPTCPIGIRQTLAEKKNLPDFAGVWWSLPDSNRICWTPNWTAMPGQLGCCRLGLGFGFRFGLGLGLGVREVYICCFQQSQQLSWLSPG